jgi:AcrR family transcriptional regulator
VAAQQQPTPTPAHAQAIAGGDVVAIKHTPAAAFARARELFRSGSKLDMGALAAELGIARATLYRWTGDRDKLLGDVAWVELEAVLDHIERTTPGTGADYLERGSGAFLDLISDNPTLRAFLAAEGDFGLRVLTAPNGRLRPRLVRADPRHDRGAGRARRLPPARRSGRAGRRHRRAGRALPLPPRRPGDEPGSRHRAPDDRAPAARALPTTSPLRGPHMHPRPRLVLVPAALAALALVFCAPASAAVPKLPKRFLWGVSGSGFQSEGHTTGANWNHYIERDSRPGAEEPKEPYRNSVDFYRRYRSDIGLAAGLGVNVYRISINWTRVEPRPGKFSEKGLRFYDRVVREMRRRGIQPLITLNHWDYPMWVYDQGGWTSKKTVQDFLALTRVIAKRYARQTRWWLTFNEEFFFEFIEKGNYPLTDAQVPLMRANLIAAHRGAYDVIHRYDRDARVSTNYAWPGPRRRGPDRDRRVHERGRRQDGLRRPGLLLPRLRPGGAARRPGRGHLVADPGRALRHVHGAAGRCTRTSRACPSS